MGTLTTTILSLFAIPILILLIVFLDRIGELFDKILPKKEDHTGIFCECGNNMSKGTSFISDTYDENGDNHVKYKCEACGLEYDYNFDIAPVPINWKDLAEVK